MKKLIFTTILLLIINSIANSQQIVLDNFESLSGWDFIKSDGVQTAISTSAGHEGNAVRFDYDFTKGTGYGGIQKWFPLDLPENFEITFWLKASSPANNFEIKLIDSTGNNVWWLSNRNYTFPTEWKKIRIKKRHISFAWGPIQDQTLNRIDRIEFTVASFIGGKGSVWIDDLRFEELEAETNTYPSPFARASSSIKSQSENFLFDADLLTFWQSKPGNNQALDIDFRKRRELGGLVIHWKKGMAARSFELMFSENNENQESVYKVDNNLSDQSFIWLPEAETRYLRLVLTDSESDKGYGINEIEFLSVAEAHTKNDFILQTAKRSPKGNYPAYFLDRGTFWTISGVNNDVKEAMISEDGMVEVDKASFSIEPIIKDGDQIINWANVQTEQSMGERDGSNLLDFVPTVYWKSTNLELKTQIVSVGEANKSSRLNIIYTLKNLTKQTRTFEFYLLIRPFQVNPHYQFLNLPGGVGHIRKISREEDHVIKVDAKQLFLREKPDYFAALTFDQGNPVELIDAIQEIDNQDVDDKHELASGIVKYVLELLPGQQTELMLVAPYYPIAFSKEFFDGKSVEQARAFWRDKTSYVDFDLPASADKLLETYRSNLAYILINRDKAGIQPGSRSYERSWIRDGSLTSSALLKSGIVPEVKDFIRWYSAHLYENGKVPCVVDFRGPDPVPENDSHGQFIYLIREYFNFTHDTVFLLESNPAVIKAVDYISELIAERSAEHFKTGNDSVRAYYGLVPESISHEGYSAKPMHSYWDNFFTIKGLKDAADIQHILGQPEEYERIALIRDNFSKNLYESLRLAMQTRHIDYIPGCVELGDFDATSTTVALNPCNELKNLPKPQIYNTFDKYYEFFVNRRDGKKDWINYTPYENRVIGSFIFLDEPQKAHELIDFFLADQRPQGWHHWAEVVWKDERTPKFIGDMPHTWVGSDFINAFRSMFVYENEYDSTLVVGAALYQDWIDSAEGMAVRNLPTYYGELSYSIIKQDDVYQIKLEGDLKLPENGIRIRNFNGKMMPASVHINGKASSKFSSKEIEIHAFPAIIEIKYNK